MDTESGIAPVWRMESIINTPLLRRSGAWFLLNEIAGM
jgi:hypothetical protein